MHGIVGGAAPQCKLEQARLNFSLTDPLELTRSMGTLPLEDEELSMRKGHRP